MSTDFLRLDAFLQPEERMIRDNVRRLVDQKVQPYVADWFEQESFPVHLARELGEIGLLDASLPDSGGLSPIGYGLLCQELERGDSGIRSFVSVQNSLVALPLSLYGSQAQKQQWLPKLSSGETIGCSCLVEPGRPVSADDVEPTARAVAGGWALNGRVSWVTNAPVCDLVVVWARADGAADGVRGFVVPRSARGVSVRPIRQRLSLRACSTGVITLDDCPVADEQVLPAAVGFRAPMRCLSDYRYAVCWGVVGAMASCYETALSYATTHFQFQRPIAQFPLIQEGLVDMATHLAGSQMLAYQLGRLKAVDALADAQIALVQRHNCAAARSVAAQARSILGGNGITLDYAPIRVLANLEAVSAEAGALELHPLLAAESLVGNA
ncbi:MAG: acyl-CoA dehydrogenase family protein [Chloroflexi bacterium]|nr:acyl-CoA dehydrogenase family protein [Chloroflexota bacterium]